ncbi:hypothetical protein SEA_KENNA_52 [Gordonia phage Kenna]|uniref:Uncharacterized protein n=2 Tax=Getalongvirus kenna TaxID=2734201 RepID=A0A3S9UPV2_9CAUD|nr:hypothetical protein HOU97_gp52 [Gordonia phage Kenna]AZS12329.1 hypothetical protein SEA_KENNA_52 [Gordonia phage Kenna]QCG77210.1 hypothetical protein SEA_LUTUM_53 [Gordonia phage Lutum]
MTDDRQIAGVMRVDGEVVCVRYTDGRPRVRDVQDAAAELPDPDGPEFGA